MAHNIKEYVSFYFENFIPQPKNIAFEGRGAGVTDKKLRLTKADEPLSEGKAFHKNPVNTRRVSSEGSNVTSFFTCFSFSIQGPDDIETADHDQLSFLLAPLEGGAQDVWVKFNNKTTDSKIVLHIGSTEKSGAWVFENGNEAIVYISYDHSSFNLKATWVYPSSDVDTGKFHSVSINDASLGNAIPEWVKVGFSANSGNPAAHDVNSWYFASAFGEDAVNLAEPLKTLSPYLASFLNLHFPSASN